MLLYVIWMWWFREINLSITFKVTLLPSEQPSDDIREANEVVVHQIIHGYSISIGTIK